MEDQDPNATENNNEVGDANPEGEEVKSDEQGENLNLEGEDEEHEGEGDGEGGEHKGEDG